jgi:hypothetical protein
VTGLPPPPTGPRGGFDAELDSPPTPSTAIRLRGLNAAGVAALLAGVAALALAMNPALAVLALPVAVLAAGLGVLGIGRARRQGQGRGAAIAGVVLALLATAVAVAWVVLLATEREFTETFRDGFREALRDEGGVFALRPGDCFDLPEDLTEVSALPLVPCDEPHDAEVFGRADHPATPGAPFPGPMVLIRFAYAECEDEAFTQHVGIPLERSELDMDVIYPDQGSWRLGERTVVCFLFDPDGPLERPAAGSRR